MSLSVLFLATCSGVGVKKDSGLVVMFGNSNFFLKFNPIPLPAEYVSSPNSIGSPVFSVGNPFNAYDLLEFNRIEKLYDEPVKPSLLVNFCVSSTEVTATILSHAPYKAKSSSSL